MNNFTSKEIREIFLKYFQNKNHLMIDGSSIIPDNDPTLLFINSGMAPLKKYFIGEAMPPNSELCNVQPCIRTIDIDEVGDKHHLTSFQMLGSWSINNYFKESAISLAYELLVKHFKIPKNKLYVTVFSGDERYNLEPDKESAAIWEKAGVHKDHIVYQPFEDNFWGPTATVGPCGPCTEVFFDTEDEDGIKYILGGEFDTKKRYIEIWNAGVFMQFNKNKEGIYDELKFKSVDTGAGLERLTMALNGYESVYDIDEIKAVINCIDEQLICNKKTLSEKEKRIIADHLRTVVFILSEGICPSNYGRGYIPRKLIRKVTTVIEKNKIESFDFNKILKLIINIYGDFYKKFVDNKKFIIKEFNNEQIGFKKVVQEGFKRLDERYQNNAVGIDGENVFELVTTYGLPFELIEEYAEQNNITINKAEYQQKLNDHKEKSHGVSGKDKNLKDNLEDISILLESYKKTEFVGYERLECKASILGIINKDNEVVDCINEQEEGILILDKSCFYAECGGQIADTGKIKKLDNLNVSVLDIQKSKSGIFVHMVKVEYGQIRVRDEVILVVDKKRRRAISANHTTVHLLQSALRRVLGDSIRQMGSYVNEDRFRFDFSYETKLSKDKLNEIEQIVNENIQKGKKLEIYEKGIDEAINGGALAFFDSKYGDVVRVVNFEGISKEVCGGTHISNTAKIGVFRIVSETSVAKGIRRISGVTAMSAVKYIQEQENLLNEVIKRVEANPENLLAKLDTILNNKKQKLNKKINVQGNIKKLKIKNNVECVVSEFSEYSSELRNLTYKAAEQIKGVAIYFCNADKFNVIVAVDKLICDQMDAREILESILENCNGKGGGNSHLAFGGINKVIDVNKFVKEIECRL